MMTCFSKQLAKFCKETCDVHDVEELVIGLITAEKQRIVAYMENSFERVAPVCWTTRWVSNPDRAPDDRMLRMRFLLLRRLPMPSRRPSRHAH